MAESWWRIINPPLVPVVCVSVPAYAWANLPTCTPGGRQCLSLISVFSALFFIFSSCSPLSFSLSLSYPHFFFFFIYCSCRSHRLLCDKVQLQTRSCNFVVGLNENTPLLVSFYTKLSHVSPVIHGPKGLIRLLNGRNKGGWHLRHYKYKQRWKVTKYINLSRTSILLFLSRRIILTLSPSSFIFLVKEF